MSFPEEVRQGQKVTISESHAPILQYGGVVSLLCPNCFVTKVCFFAVSNTSSSTVPFMNDFLGYCTVWLTFFDLGQLGKQNK